MTTITSDNSELFFELSGSGNFVRLEPFAYELPLSSHNWVKTKVIIKGGAFTGNYIAPIPSDDFKYLKKQIEPFYENLNGELEFNDLKHAINLKIKGDGIGHFSVDVTARDYPGPDFSELLFTIVFDQTEIKNLINQLDKIIKQFP